MHDPIKNALAYFATAVSYKYKDVYETDTRTSDLPLELQML